MHLEAHSLAPSSLSALTDMSVLLHMNPIHPHKVFSSAVEDVKLELGWALGWFLVCIPGSDLLVSAAREIQLRPIQRAGMGIPLTAFPPTLR